MSAGGDVMASRQHSTQHWGAKGAGKAMLAQNDKPVCLLEGCNHQQIQIPGMCFGFLWFLPTQCKERSLIKCNKCINKFSCEDFNR